MRRAALLIVLLLFSSAVRAETWRFAVIGDTPYNDYERNELPGMLAAIAAEHPAFIIHAGDFKHGQTPCTDAVFDDRLALFNASPVPFVFVPGDNEWSDCDRVSAGSYSSQERLAKLRNQFFQGDTSLGESRIPLQRQSSDTPEHQRWQLGPVLFLTLNVPGGNNNWLKNGNESEEARQRMPAVLSWLGEGFAQARQDGMRGIVITMQANPGFKHYRAGVGHGGYRALLDALRKEVQGFDGEVLLVHGDTHWQRTDHPLSDPKSGAAIRRFTRLETFGYPYMGWLDVFIDTDAAALFRVQARSWPRTQQ